MGVDVLIFMKKKDVEKLLSDYGWQEFVIHMYMICGIRWYRFCRMWGFDDDIGIPKITSRDMLKQLAKGKAKVKNKDFWVDFLAEYELIAVADISEELDNLLQTTDWVCVNYVLGEISKLVMENAKKIVENAMRE